MIDDLGARDLAAYGHAWHATPNIDRLATDGLRFTRAYAASPVCAPTRAALLTGLSPARLHLTDALPPLPAPRDAGPAGDRGPADQKVTVPQSATFLPADVPTLAERLRALGYHTALVGKWHLGRAASGPQSRGFDVAVGGEDEAAPRSFYEPFGLSRLPDRGRGESLTDRLTEEAIAFLDASAGRPFFLLLSHFAVHTPIEVPPDRVRDWSARLPPAPGGGREPEGSLRAAYAVMLEDVDSSVGRVLAELERLGIARDTLVVLTSDNGGVAETPDTGQIVTDNAPLRGGKATLYEGGLRVPLLVRWPAVVKPRTESDVLTSSADWFATLLEIAGGEDGRAGAKIGGEPRGGDSQPAARERVNSLDALDGVSLLPVLRGERPERERPRGERTLHFYYPHYIAGFRPDPARETWWNTPGAAVRSGALKWIRRFDDEGELYDLDADPGETHDLAMERPDDARRLDADLEHWLTAEGAQLPRRNLDYDPGAFARSVEQSLAQLGHASEWTPNGDCTRRVAAGSLDLDCTDTPFIVGPEMIVSGPIRVEARFVTTGTRGAPALWYRSVEKPAFSGDRIDFGDAAANGVREAHIDRSGTIRQLRLDFGRGKGGRAAVDWIRIRRDGDAGAPLVEWRFDREEP